MDKIINIMPVDNTVIALCADGSIWKRIMSDRPQATGFPKYKWRKLGIPKNHPKLNIPQRNSDAWSTKPPPQPETVCRDYGLIDSIKFLRSECGCGLKEAKDAVESGINATIQQARFWLHSNCGYYK